MAVSDIALVGRALVTIGARPISSFSDGTAEAMVASTLYAPARDAVLSAYPWSFATAQASLTTQTTAPIVDFDYAFELPADFLRALSAGTGGRGQGIDYRIIGGALHTNVPEPVLSYIFRPDETAFPPFFQHALVARLTAEFCLPLTESTSRMEALVSLADIELQRARLVDAQQDVPPRFEDYSLVEVRN